MNISSEQLLWLLVFGALSLYQMVVAKLRARAGADPEHPDEPASRHELEREPSPFPVEREPASPPVERAAPPTGAPLHKPARAEPSPVRFAAPAHTVPRKPLPARSASMPAASWRQGLSVRSSVQLKRAFAWTVILGPPRSLDPPES